MMLGEALVMGLVATVIGLPAGLGLAWLLRSGLAQANFPSDIPLELTVQTVVVALFVGVLVTVLAALIPSYKARQVTPIDGLSDNPTAEKEHSSNFALAAAGLAVAILSLGGAIIANTWPVYLGGSLVSAVGLAVFLIKNTATTKKYFGLGLVLFAIGLFVGALIVDLGTASTFALIGAGALIVLIGASQASAALASPIAHGVGSCLLYTSPSPRD